MLITISFTILESIWIEGCASGIFEQINLSQRKLIADQCDIEILEDLPKVNSAKFGQGSSKSGAAIPFRIRRRALGAKE
jgi:hypothetical protein